MSVRVMSQVWESSSASGGGLLALLAIADFAKITVSHGLR